MLRIKDYSVSKNAARSKPTNEMVRSVTDYRQREFIDPFNKKLGTKGKLRKSDIDSNGGPTEDISLPSGSKVYHVTGKDRDQFSSALNRMPDRLFVATEQDKDKYAGFFAASKRVRSNFTKPVYQIEIELKKDVKAPSHEKQVQLFTEYFDKKRELATESMAEAYAAYDAAVKKEHPQHEAKTKAQWVKTINEDFTKYDLQKYGYETFIQGYCSPSESRKFSDRYYEAYKEFGNLLQQRGYNAVLDENDVTGSYMLANKPIILLDVLNKVGSIRIRELNDTEIYRNMLGL